MTRNEMILALTVSSNDDVRRACFLIVQHGYNEDLIADRLTHCGSFLQAVLTGDYETALSRADMPNRWALDEFKNSKS
jgi:hypothetical protein